MKKRLFGLLLTIITTISLVGCGAKNSSDLAVNAQAAGNTDVAASVSESEDSTLVFAGAGFDTQNFNPALAMTMLSKYVLNAVFDGLTETDENGKVTGAIAESFEESDDHLTYTFNLRKDVKFQNGDALTANDVTYTFDRYLQDDAVNGATLKNYVDSYEQPDDYTIVIHLKKLYPFFVSSIGGIRILPKAYIEENGEEYFNDHPIGTGVYQITEIVPDTSVTLTAIDGHWRDNPDYKTIIVRNIPEASTQLALLKTGEVDIAALNFDNLAELESFPNITVKNLSKTTMTAILVQGAWENTGEAVQNEDVRRALDYAINREDIVNAFFDGYAAPEKYWKSSETGEHWDDSWKATEYDPEKAKELLAKAGYPGAFEKPTVRLYVASGDFRAQLAELIASYWQAVGIQVEIHQLDETLEMQLLRGNGQELTEEGVGAVFLHSSPCGLSDGLLSKEIFYTTTGRCSIIRDDVSVDELFSKGLEADTLDERNEYDLKLMQKVDDELKYSFGVAYIDQLWGVSPKVGSWLADHGSNLGGFTSTYFKSIKK